MDILTTTVTFFTTHWVLTSILGSFFALITLFALDVAARVNNRPNWMPSVWIAWLAEVMWNLFHSLLNALVALADVFGFIKRFALWIRDKFFGWIPRAIIEASWRELRAAFWALFQAPLGAIWGVWDGLHAAHNPVLAGVLFTLACMVGPGLWEVVFYVMQWSFRPTTLMHALASTIWDVGYQVAYTVTSIQNLKQLVMAIIEPVLNVVFGWVSKEAIKHSTDQLWNETAHLFNSWRGAVSGFEAGGVTQPVAMGLVGLCLIAIALYIGYLASPFLYIRLLVPIWGILGMLVAPTAVYTGGDDDSEDDDDDDDGDDDDNGAGVDKQPRKRSNPTAETRVMREMSTDVGRQRRRAVHD